MKPNEQENGKDRVLSPDNLNHTLQVAAPGMIFIIVIILILMVGFLIWAIFGNVERTIGVHLFYEDDRQDYQEKHGEALTDEDIATLDEDIRNVSALGPNLCMALVEEKDVSQVEGDMKVRTASWTGSIVSVSESPVRLHSTRLYPVFVSYPLNTETKETDAEIILEEFKPISYLIR